MKIRVKLPGAEVVAGAAGAGAKGEGGWWHETSSFRRFLPQLIVTVINNMLLMDLSMMLAFPTLVIGALYLNDTPDEDGLILNAVEASWLGSLVYIFQPLGSLVSGWVTEPMGRRRGMLLANAPPLLGWLLLRFSRSVQMLLVSNALLGLSIGFMEAPVLCYVGEVSEPRVRSLLTAFTGVMAQAGYLLVYLLGATMSWRDAASVCAAIPVISALLMLLVPESPLWLLARSRETEALQSLRWLRGWVRPQAVEEELSALADYAHHTKLVKESVGSGCWATARELVRRETLRPLLLVVAFFLVFHASGMSGVRPYMVHVAEAFALPFDPNWTAVATAVLGLLATLALIALVARVGKRRLALVSVAGCAGACAVLGAYAFAVGPSPDPANAPAQWLTLTAFIALSFFTYFGVGQIPWMYVAEVLPLRSRGVASGVTAACAYVLYFTAAKTYLQLEGELGLHGVFWLYAACGVAGFLFIFFYLPETEGKTLAEVEALFASPAKDGKAPASAPAPDTVVTHM